MKQKQITQRGKQVRPPTIFSTILEVRRQKSNANGVLKEGTQELFTKLECHLHLKVEKSQLKI